MSNTLDNYESIQKSVMSPENIYLTLNSIGDLLNYRSKLSIEIIRCKDDHKHEILLNSYNQCNDLLKQILSIK